MRLTGTIRPNTTTELVASGHDRGSAYEALGAQVQSGHTLTRAHFAMKAGVTTATGEIRPDRTEPVEAEGATYTSAAAALRAQVPAGYVLLQAVVL
ncbi:hypothetical protein ACFWWU_36595 [Streptomyces sp. NPDC058650]|uniref:hypothetical protein n=1 Tax=Streptomyces sp. NPDC058650 TaxID=3346575 RepID=UPI0036594FA3